MRWKYRLFTLSFVLSVFSTGLVGVMAGTALADSGITFDVPSPQAADTTVNVTCVGGDVLNVFRPDGSHVYSGTDLGCPDTFGVNGEGLGTTWDFVLCDSTVDGAACNSDSISLSDALTDPGFVAHETYTWNSPPGTLSITNNPVHDWKTAIGGLTCAVNDSSHKFTVYGAPDTWASGYTDSCGVDLSPYSIFDLMHAAGGGDDCPTTGFCVDGAHTYHVVEWSGTPSNPDYADASSDPAFVSELDFVVEGPEHIEGLGGNDLTSITHRDIELMALGITFFLTYVVAKQFRWRL